ncbi:MAG: acetyltransferase [Gammaproteobacteria bacterium]|jgi:acetyltransferase-like isoleucine patch superfamily enzyme|nr:acetyltransferase [Gammaproteobacteria bacterium]MAO98517.1 acetyltransferase [Gammaproteobacteria bacterium]|tara:strand:+ start:7650 stop:8258 length:609 start_codon:yes stop_codon:yes gene_type:complete
MILKPQYLRLFGTNISIGNFVTIICASDRKVDLSTWQTDKLNGEIFIDDYVLMSPGTNLRCAKKISIGKSSMIASDVTITDSDWHGIYDRTDYVALPKEVEIEENVWIGERSIVLKGSKIGKNSIIGAGSVVAGDIPENCIFAGNPAKFVKKLDKNDFKTRESLFEESSTYLEDLIEIEKRTTSQNTLYSWIRSVFWPKNED